MKKLKFVTRSLFKNVTTISKVHYSIRYENVVTGHSCHIKKETTVT